MEKKEKAEDQVLGALYSWQVEEKRNNQQGKLRKTRRVVVTWETSESVLRRRE